MCINPIFIATLEVSEIFYGEQFEDTGISELYNSLPRIYLKRHPGPRNRTLEELHPKYPILAWEQPKPLIELRFSLWADREDG